MNESDTRPSTQNRLTGFDQDGAANPDGAHDTLLSEQIHSAANFVSKSTGAELADLPALRPAIVAAVRRLYDGLHEVTPNAAHNAWMAPYRSFKPPE